jgi:hypothetical protein
VFQNPGAAVLVCGWAGSKRNNVEKYTDLFAKNFGFNTYGCILPMNDFTRCVQLGFFRGVAFISHYKSHKHCVKSSFHNSTAIVPSKNLTHRRDSSLDLKFFMQKRYGDQGIRIVRWHIFYTKKANFG